MGLVAWIEKLSILRTDPWIFHGWESSGAPDLKSRGPGRREGSQNGEGRLLMSLTRLAAQSAVWPRVSRVFSVLVIGWGKFQSFGIGFREWTTV